MNECSGARERSQQCGASERVSGVSERVNGRATGPVPQSVFLDVLDHSAFVYTTHPRLSIYLLRPPFFPIACHHLSICLPPSSPTLVPALLPYIVLRLSLHLLGNSAQVSPSRGLFLLGFIFLLLSPSLHLFLSPPPSRRIPFSHFLLFSFVPPGVSTPLPWRFIPCTWLTARLPKPPLPWELVVRLLPVLYSVIPDADPIYTYS